MMATGKRDTCPSWLLHDPSACLLDFGAFPQPLNWAFYGVKCGGSRHAHASGSLINGTCTSGDGLLRTEQRMAEAGVNLRLSLHNVVPSTIPSPSDDAKDSLWRSPTYATSHQDSGVLGLTINKLLKSSGGYQKVSKLRLTPR
jgi:hypothetical protein